MHGKVFAGLLVFMACSQGPDTGAPVVTEATVSEPAEDYAAEYRRLRAVPSRWTDPNVQEWSDDVDSFGGRKHVVMEALRAQLGTSGTTRASVIAAMGPPDEMGLPSSDGDAPAHGSGVTMVVSKELAAGGASQVLVYHWRGLHDFLYFVVQGDRVLRSAWWMAGE
jgi:hypothetical protein